MIAGVAHGDIKPSNFLVQDEDDLPNCILNDFGSCVILGQSRLPTISPPWSAPELYSTSHELGFHDLRQADIYSLALVCIHLLVPLSVLQGAGLCFLRQDCEDNAKLDVIHELEQAKCSTGPNSLESRFLALIHQIDIAKELVSLLDVIIHRALRPCAEEREMPWAEIFELTRNSFTPKGYLPSFYLPFYCFLYTIQ